jgi:hypothetical protein
MHYYTCIDCERRRNEISRQHIAMATEVRQKAIQQKTTYIIYYDKEDSKLRNKKLEEFIQEEEYVIFEYISG